MWPIIWMAGLLLLGFAALVVCGVAAVHVSYRWWLMLMCGMDWDDAGVLIHARARRRHGVHETASWPGAGWQDTGVTDDHPGPVYRPGSRMAQRLAALAADAQLPMTMITHATGKPPWEDATHEIPAVPDVSHAETETWLRPGGGLDQTVQMPVPRDRRD
jgi:hypothetical protein